jgi:tetraacyldisaccharide 4'-kinase
MIHLKNILLYPVSVIYGLITGFRNFLYDAGIISTVEFPFPIICVGNITVGGTGKTPHTEYITGLLRENFKVATLSRGYKRKTRDFRIASSTAPVTDIGDEPMQIFRNFPDVPFFFLIMNDFFSETTCFLMAICEKAKEI